MKPKRGMFITIDGPSGVGKSTTIQAREKEPRVESRRQSSGARSKNVAAPLRRKYATIASRASAQGSGGR